MSFLIKYSSEQIDVIEAPADIDQIVTACPGSGKTTVIIGRIMYLASQGMSVDKMLYLTYSKKLADEGNKKLCEHAIESMWHSGTIDSLCWKFLRDRCGDDFYCEPGQIIKRTLDIWEKDPDWNPCPGVRQGFLDESQDLDAPRFEVLRRICKTCSMTIVGDPRQAIYQGLFDADPNLMMMIKPKAIVKHLSTCFRCTPEIVRFVNAAFRYPGLPEMVSSRDASGILPNHIRMHGDSGNMGICRDEIVNAVVRRVQQLLKESVPSDIMILSPTVRNKSLHLLNRIRTGLGRYDVASFLNKAEHDSSMRGRRTKHGSVYIGTVHSSKGSEARHVVLLNCYVGNGAFHRIDHLDKANPDYKNLVYVACTRAKDTLDLFETCHMPNRCEAIEFFSNNASYRNMMDIRVAELGPLKMSAMSPPSGVTDVIQSLPLAAWSELDSFNIQRAIKSEHSLNKTYEPPRFVTMNNDNDLYGTFMEMVIVRHLAQVGQNVSILKDIVTLPMHLSDKDFRRLRFQENGARWISDEKFEFTLTDRDKLDAFIRQYHANRTPKTPIYTDLRNQLENMNIFLSPSDKLFYDKLDTHRHKLEMVCLPQILTATLIVEIWHTMLLKTYHQHQLALYWLKSQSLTCEDLLPRGASNWTTYLKDIETLCTKVCGDLKSYQVPCSSPAQLRGIADYVTVNNNIVDIKCVACETAMPSLSHRLQVSAYRSMLGSPDRDAYLISALSLSAYAVPADECMDQRILEILENHIPKRPATAPTKTKNDIDCV